MAKPRGEQQGSAETRAEKMAFCRGGIQPQWQLPQRHHELMPGCLMKVSGPKEHLSVTSAPSAREGLGHRGSSSRARHGWSGARSQQESFPSWLVNVTCVIWNVTATISGWHFPPKKELITLMQWSMSKEQKLSRCQRNLTNGSLRGKSACSSNLMEHYLPRTVCFCT